MTTLRKRTDLRTSAWADDGQAGLAVYDPRSDDGFLLDPTRAAVFEACDGTTSREEMADRVASRTGLPLDADVVDVAIEELLASGLIVSVLSPQSSSTSTTGKSTGLSRRVLLGRLAVGAGAAALLPAIDMVGGVSRLAADPDVHTPADEVIPTLVAQDKAATTPEGTAVAVTLSTTGGFTSPDSTAFQVQTDPSHGTVSLVGAVAQYTPAPGFVGTDTFTYIAWQCVAFVDFVLACPDGTGPFPEAGSDPATVTITVTAPDTTTTGGVAPTTEAKQAVQSTATPRFTG